MHGCINKCIHASLLSLIDMNLDKEKFYSLLPNYAALREWEEKYYHKPTEEEIYDFLVFWDEVYRIWREMHRDLKNESKIEHKAKVRLQLNKLTTKSG